MAELILTSLNGMARGLLLFTLASGLSMLFGLMSVLNLAHGALLLLGGYIAVSATDLFATGGIFVGAPIAVIVGGLLGLLLYLTIRPISGRGHLDQGLFTLGVAFVFADVSQMIWGAELFLPAAPSPFEGSVTLLGQQYPVYRLVVIGVGIAIAGSVFWAFERTRLGAIVKAAVSDSEMVSALGIRVALVTGGVFMGAAALAAFGGLAGAPIIGVRPGLDTEMLILALVVVVIGGLGSLKGALVGALLIGEVQTLGVALLPALSSFLLFGAMALVLLFKPAGLYGGSDQ